VNPVLDCCLPGKELRRLAAPTTLPELLFTIHGSLKGSDCCKTLAPSNIWSCLLQNSPLFSVELPAEGLRSQPAGK
jgi:hypothetical protein